MNNYLDLPDTKLKLTIDLEIIGRPNFSLSVIPSDFDRLEFESCEFTRVLRSYYIDLLTPFSIIIELSDKVYTTEYETAVNIKRLSVDDIPIIPEYTHYSYYDNDHDFKNPTNYIGFNGKWVLTFNRPFYQWLHQAQNQGWLIG